MRAKLPGANDQAWRVASGHAYSGNTIGTGIVTADVISFQDVEVLAPRLSSVSVGRARLGSVVVSVPNLGSVEVVPA
jgi:hypothetical protein